MLASVSTVGSSVMAKYLNDIVPRMLESLRSQEGVQVHVRCMEYAACVYRNYNNLCYTHIMVIACTVCFLVLTGPLFIFNIFLEL